MSTTPMPQEDVLEDGCWLSAHEMFVSEAKDKEPDVLFLGDSLIAFLQETEFYKEMLAPLHCVCFGLLNDTTSNILWRIANGELDGFNPKVIVISGGSCNRDKSSGDILNGIVAVAEETNRKQPQAQIFVTKLLPRGKAANPRRNLICQVNESLTDRLKEIPNTTALDIDPGFIANDGSMDHHDAWDYVHLTQEGYKKAFETVHIAIMSVLQPDA